MKLVPVAAVIQRLNVILTDPQGTGLDVHEEIAKLIAALEFWEAAMPGTAQPGKPAKRTTRKRRKARK